MKKLKILLYGVLLVAVAAGIFALKCYLSPIEIYEMPINAWKRKVWNIPGPTRKEENLVIYNHLGKSEMQIRDAVIAYNDRTVSIDTIKKYRIYSRDFFKRDRTLNKHYTEEPDGSDIIFDHAERGVFFIRWEKDRRDSLVDIEINSESYRVPISDSTWHIISSVRLLESNDKYLLFPRKVEE